MEITKARQENLILAVYPKFEDKSYIATST